MVNPFVLLNGDAAEMLDLLPDASVQCCVTSPPYWGLRNYGTARWDGGDSACEHVASERYYTEKTAAVSSAGAFSDAGAANADRLKKGRWRESGVCTKCGAAKVDAQLGMEKTPEDYVASLVKVFAEVWRVLKPDGTLWLNLGDSYNAAGRKGHGASIGPKQNTNRASANGHDKTRPSVGTLKPKDLIGIPWRVAFALQEAGWWLRQDIIWSKPNPMPESVTDRCTKSHEYVFLLTKSERYYFDAEAIAEPLTCMRMRGSGPMVNPGTGRNDAATGTIGDYRKPYLGKATKDYVNGGAQDASATKARIVDRILSGEITTRNKRSVWEVVPASFKGAHFATFPPKLITPCVLAGSRPGDVVLDPFLGSGTTAEVALSLGRKCYGIELNPEYLPLIHKRTAPHLLASF